MESLNGLSVVPTNADESVSVKSTFDCIKAKWKNLMQIKFYIMHIHVQTCA